jgi:uncharacterized membrane protein
MQPDAWTDKSVLALMTLPLIGAALVLVMWLAGVSVIRAKLQIDPQNPALSFAQHRVYRRRMSHSMGFLTLCIALMFALIGAATLWPGLHIPFWATLLLPMIPASVIVFVSVLSGQGGCKITPKTVAQSDAADAQAPSVPGRGDDKYWALGMFYHNPEDPAFLVENRFGNNLGFNYARLPVKIGAAIGLAMLIALYVWATAVLTGPLV